ncbi:MAG TPA: hypothetical protein VFA20_09455 [Myxococcaceae bacterium]|nr:hypothetical protein [Myxococcaceae bacterium]
MKVTKMVLVAGAIALGMACPGPKGDKGDVGPVGPQGPMGPTGAKGDPGNPLAAVLPIPVYDGDTHQLNTVNMSVAQAICLSRHGIWDSGTSTCGNPLAYGTANVPRTDSDAAAVANCPTGYTPADCDTAFFLLQFWRMNPNREALPNGHAWCAGTMDGTLNSGAGLNGAPGYWYAGTAGGIATPNICPSGYALVIDQLTGAEFQTVYGRPSYPRIHMYCIAVSQTNPWMCVSTNLP